MATQQRIEAHPILAIGRKEDVSFYWKNQKLTAKKGEMISSALFASGIKVFGTHHKDRGPMGIFCANGQCSQCAVIANGVPVKACVTAVEENMVVQACDGIPKLVGGERGDASLKFHPVPVIKTQVVIIGGGPAGLKAAVELANLKIRSVVVDDKPALGGKLALQTHTFFGSVDDCYAGTRGVDIAVRLDNDVRSRNEVSVMSSTQAVAVFSDNRVGVVQDGRYYLIEADVLLVAAGAREKALSFQGCDLPGVYGAGAFQTLVNKDLIRTSNQLLIVGAGNVGLIAGYHALQAGMAVMGVIEAASKVSGYKVHRDKLVRLGVPVLLQHTILSANSNREKTGIESATIAQVDAQFKVIPGTERVVPCDTVLVAAGLNPCDEFYRQAKEFGLKAFMAGDAEEIAEASAAMFSGKIAAIKIANALGMKLEIPQEYYKKMEVLKSKPGRTLDRRRREKNTKDLKVFPVFHCYQEIPCNPCVTSCTKRFISLKGDSGTLMDLPYWDGPECSGCTRCAVICPGLAVTIVDRRKVPEGMAHVFLPFELIPTFSIGGKVKALDVDGALVGEMEVVDIVDKKWQDKTLMIKVLCPLDKADQIVGIKVQERDLLTEAKPVKPVEGASRDGNIICRCEKVRDKEIRQLIRDGVTDMNCLKALRCTMGACGGKTCVPLIKRMYAEEGYDLSRITETVPRPLNAEIRLATFANVGIEKEPDYESDL